MTNVGGLANVALAEALARWAHTGQVDKNGYDYIDHPRAVFYRIYADDPEDYDGQIVAWLHDVLEDSTVDPTTLRAFFPGYIVDAVVILSRNYSLPGDNYYLAIKENALALRVKLHDIAHNTSPKRMNKLDEKTRARLTKKYQHALEVLTN